MNMTTPPLVSIIVPCYNQAHFLDECLVSIIKQTYTNWECIVINDGSTDATSKVAKKWVIKEQRFRYINKENGGLSNARNTGIKEAKGDYFLFLDSDDIILPEKLNKSISILQEEKSDVVLTNFLRLKGNTKKVKKAFCILKKKYFTYENILLKWDTIFTFPPHCIIISKEALGENKFNEKLRAKEDWVMWLNVFEKNPKVSFIDEALVYYRRHSKNMTKDSSHMIKNMEKSYSEILSDIDGKYLNDFIKKGFSDRLNEIEYLKNKILKHRKIRKLFFIVAAILLITNCILFTLYIQK